MIDFHTHILPNVDDGANCINETIALLQEAKRAGFETVILTPHYIESYYEANVNERIKLINSIKELLKKNRIDIKLALGNEIYITNNINQLIKEKRACTINNTRYVLFELPFNTNPINLYELIYDILQNGYIPILAHPERYEFVQQNPRIINDLIEKGVLMQANYGSFIGQYGEKAQVIIKKLLKNNMIHFLGTDVHRKNTIYNKIPKILFEIEKFIGAEQLEQITTINPKLVLEDKLIEIGNQEEVYLSIIDRLIMKIK